MRKETNGAIEYMHERASARAERSRDRTRGLATFFAMRGSAREEKNTRLFEMEEWEVDSLREKSPFQSAIIDVSSATRWPATIFERCLSSLDQIYSYKFQKALDSSPKKSLLAAVVVPRKAVPKIRVLVVGLLVGVFVRPPQHPRRRARADPS